MSRRFDYVKYDAQATAEQAQFKDKCTELEQMIGGLDDGRAKSLALTKLEEVYMWIGKALRDEQIGRTSFTPDVPERTNS